MSLQGDLDDRAGTVEPPVAVRTKHSVGELFRHGAFMRLWLSRFFGTASNQMLIVVSLAVGAVRAFQMPTQQALTSMVLPSALLPPGLASLGRIARRHRTLASASAARTCVEGSLTARMIAAHRTPASRPQETPE